MITNGRSALSLRALFHSSTTPRHLQSSSKAAPQRIFIEKLAEDPVVVIAEDSGVDIIGPPDSVSNLRPIIRKRSIHETTLQKRLREMYDATQLWNQQFWMQHNTNFIKERQDYINSRQTLMAEKRLLTADEMSEFYKNFLDRNWHSHVRYNFEWYGRNFTLLFLALRVSLEKTALKLR